MWAVPEIWKGGTCFILGGGPSLPFQFGVPEHIVDDVVEGKKLLSAYSPYLEPLKDKHVIAINTSFLLGRWVDFIFFGDNAWFLVYEQLLKRHPGLVITCAPRFQNRKDRRIKYVGRAPKREGIYTDTKNKVAWNYNSGAAAINLAVHFGVKKIVLLGFDMAILEGKTHWHSQYNRKRLPPFKKHLQGFPQIAKDAKRLGIEIYNASHITRIKEFPIVDVKDFL